jgi:hypothetical protein
MGNKNRILKKNPRSLNEKTASKSQISYSFTFIPMLLFPLLLLIRFPITNPKYHEAFVASLPLGLLTLAFYRNVAPYFIHNKKFFYGSYALILTFITFPFRLIIEENGRTVGYFPINNNQSSKLVSDLISGNLSAGFPNKNLLFFLISILLFAVLFFLYKTQRLRDIREIFLASICSLAILLSTWKNTSWASPYSWVPSLERPKSEEYTYVVSHFSNGQGLVNADEFVNSSMVNLFNGYAYENLMLIRRPIAYYFVSQLSSLLNPYYLWISLNLITWLLAVFATYFLLRVIGFGFVPRAAASVLVSVFPLSAAYVGQSTPYFLSTLLCVFVTFSFVFFQRHLEVKTITPLILLCVMASLIYDVYFWIAFLSLAAIKLKLIGKLDALKLILVSGSAPFAYGYFFSKVTSSVIPDANQSQIGNALSGLIDTLKKGDLEVFQSEIIDTFSNSLFTVLSLLTPIVTALLVLLSIYHFWRGHALNEFSREWLFYVGIGFLIFQTIFALSNHREIGTIPRLNSFILIFFVILVSELNSRNLSFSLVSLITVSILIYQLLLNLRLVPGWQITIFNLVAGGWLPFAFN